MYFKDFLILRSIQTSLVLGLSQAYITWFQRYTALAYQGFPQICEWLSLVASSEHNWSKAAASVCPLARQKRGITLLPSWHLLLHCWRACRTNRMDSCACKSGPEGSSQLFFFFFFTIFTSGLSLQWSQYRLCLARRAQALEAVGSHSWALG